MVIDSLTVVCYSLLTPLHVAADKSHFDVLDILLKHGAKVSVKVNPCWPCVSESFLKLALIATETVFVQFFWVNLPQETWFSFFSGHVT